MSLEAPVTLLWKLDRWHSTVTRQLGCCYGDGDGGLLPSAPVFCMAALMTAQPALLRLEARLLVAMAVQPSQEHSPPHTWSEQEVLGCD